MLLVLVDGLSPALTNAESNKTLDSQLERNSITDILLRFPKIKMDANPG